MWTRNILGVWIAKWDSVYRYTGMLMSVDGRIEEWRIGIYLLVQSIYTITD